MGRKVNTELFKRNQQIINDRLSGELSLGEIAAKYGVTRERVRQIATDGGVDPKKANKKRSNFVHDRESEKAEANAGAILMLFIAGKSLKEIADSIGCQMNATKEILDEQVTDSVLAARSASKTAKLFPEARKGPRETRPERADRHWTPDAVQEALVAFAEENGGRLPSSTQYQKIAPTRDDLPSFATVRNRLGRWSDVRVDVHRTFSN